MLEYTSTEAVLSDCGNYRYSLTREWDPTLDTLLWIMLNPSTADASEDDPTIRRVVGFSRQWGYGSAVIVNAFALRSTDPAALPSHPDPVGPDNDQYIRRWSLAADHAVCAWGAHGGLHGRHVTVLSILRDHACSAMCLGTTKDGAPKHPLYLAASTPLIVYR